MDTDNLNDFVWIESIYAYHHDDDCTTCDECQEWILHRDALQSHLTGEKYCCGKCMEKAEKEFKRKNWYYSEYDDEWFEKEDDITRIQVWTDAENKYKNTSITAGTLDKLVKDGKAWIFDKEAFDTLNPGTGLPYGYKLNEKEHEYTIAKEAV